MFVELTNGTLTSLGAPVLQEEELKAAVDKAVEAETRAHEAELRTKELKVS